MAPGLDGLFELHHLAVFRYLLRQTGLRADAEDLTQEVFLRALRAIDGYEHQGRDRAWLFSIAHNLVVDGSRRARRLPRIDAGVAPDSLASNGDATLDALALEQAIGRLPALEREALVLREVVGLSYAEIAEVTGAKPDAVAARLYRARSGMRRLLGRDDGGCTDRSA
jgi:RNA polymerase sigma-70 factor (ECF subfamily)